MALKKSSRDELDRHLIALQQSRQRRSAPNVSLGPWSVIVGTVASSSRTRTHHPRDEDHTSILQPKEPSSRLVDFPTWVFFTLGELFVAHFQAPLFAPPQRVTQESTIEIIVYGSQDDLDGLDGDQEVDDALVALPRGGVLLQDKDSACM